MKTNKTIGILLAILILSPASVFAGSLECIVYNRETGTSSTAIVDYSGPFIQEVTKDMDLKIWYKPGTLTILLPSKKILHDWVKIYFDGPSEQEPIPTGFRGISSVAQFASGRFDAFKWGYWMSEITCAHPVKTL